MDKIYCAIYTRKSTSEGLDQDFTTLDSQRESAESYIASQKSLGWVALPEKYDDGGYTGANMDRPALKKLLEDINLGRVSCVVVYKVDRLSRSLIDFAKLLELFDSRKVTFVSVTQHFNTNNSMGRLTLNILLSFAQFEREIISERTKDKMAAARKKGKWVGGRPGLGYDVDPKTKTLVINKKEAELVREVFRLYQEKRTFLGVAEVLNERGLRTKRLAYESGFVSGGKPFCKKEIGEILNNYLYIGKIKYYGQIYDGQQEPIIEPEAFERVRKIMAENCVRRYTLKKNTRNPNLLIHILWCSHCKTRMVGTYTSKKNAKYRYYVCHNANVNGYDKCPTKSVNAEAMEKAVLGRIAQLISRTPTLKKKYLVINSPAWELLFPQERRRVFNLLVKAVEYNSQAKKIAIELNEPGIEELQQELTLCATNSTSN